MDFTSMGGEIMAAPEWDWPTVPNQQKHSERVTMIRPIQYECTSPVDPELFDEQYPSRRGQALTLNISSGGMLVMMDHQPSVLQLMKVNVPIPIHMTHIPTLAEVAWTRPVPLASEDLHFVGLKFIL